MSSYDQFPNSAVDFLDTNLDLLASDLDRNTHASRSILEKIRDVEDPILSETVDRLRSREKALHAQIDYLLEERVRLKRDVARARVSAHSLRKSAIVIMAIIAVLAVISMTYANELIKTKTNEIVDQKINRLDSIAVRVEKEILDLQSVLEVSSHLPQIQDTSFANSIERDLHGIPRDTDIAKRNIANNILANNPNVATVFFTLPNGDMYMAQPYYVQENLKDHNFAFRDWYKGVTETHESYLSEIFVAQGANERTLAITTPVYSGKNYVGIFGALLDVTHITNQFQRFNLEKNERLIVLDHHRNTIYDSQNPDNIDQVTRFSDTQILNALDSRSLSNTVRINGVESLILSHPIYASSNNWSVIFIQPTEYAFAEVHALFTFSAIIVGLLGSAAVVLSTIVLRTTRYGHSHKTQFEIKPRLEKQEIRKYNNRKAYALITIAIIVLAVFVVLSLIQPRSDQPAIKDKFLIENLRGDTVNTWISWRLTKEKPLEVRFLNSDEVSKEQLDAIKDALLSEESIMESNPIIHSDATGQQLKYYKGWLGALKASSHNTKFNIPTTLDVNDSVNGEGDVIFHFITVKDADGYAGYTKSITDENQILKATITIYDVESLSPDQIAAIARHEFGHALGLAHSTASEDLMAPVSTTLIPYISECDLDALNGLYNGAQNSQVICEK